MFNSSILLFPYYTIPNLKPYIMYEYVVFYIFCFICGNSSTISLSSPTIIPQSFCFISSTSFRRLFLDLYFSNSLSPIILFRWSFSNHSFPISACLSDTVLRFFSYHCFLCFFFFWTFASYCDEILVICLW